MSRTRSTGRRTVVANRSTTTPVETDEIRALTRAAGDEVVAELTQTGPADSGTYLGRGKVDELAETVAGHDAQRVVVDGKLTPSQHHTLESLLPDETVVVDRYRLVLEIFQAQAGTRRAQLQVELAQLRYDLPRIIESADEGALNKQTEKGSPVYDVRDRIDRLEGKLDSLPNPAKQFRDRRREKGFDLVTIAGYTNAGKSTLLHRLADDLSLEGAQIGDDSNPEGSSKNATAAVEDRLFKTLETTTRRATIDGRPVLATDTVGFVDDLPHDLVESFSSTLSEAATADVVVLVADASDPPARFRRRLEASLDVLAAQDVGDERIVPALNKTDRLSRSERTRRLEVASDSLSPSTPEPIPVSVLEGTNLETLRTAILDRLPEESATVRLPNCDEAMALVSRAYDRTSVETVDYEGGEVRLECRGRPSVLERFRRRAEKLERERA
ncbi:GTPase HflX [Natronorubrum sp. DTA7]|uniref:GTPase HflX n=1 Tax=Natronorubrum sp. DTA7 TaxID=3447016 RepID=UPI003F836BFE